MVEQTDSANIKWSGIFPGQGSQFVGMGQDLYQTYLGSKQLYQNAEELTGIPLTRISFQGPEDVLKQTQYTQLAIFVHSIAVWDLIKDKIELSALAGHSLGEYSALVAAGVLSFEEALQAVRVRGALMARSGDRKGAMLAVIGLDVETLNEIVQKLSGKGVITIANYNSPNQVALSGDEELLLDSIRLLKAAGARRVIPLPVGGAFHSPLMNDAAREMETILNNMTFRDPRIPIYSNVSGEVVKNGMEIKKLLINQICSPVRWIQIIANMVGDGIEGFCEIGPGKVLNGLVKRIYSEGDSFNIEGVESLQEWEKTFNGVQTQTPEQE
ncbi:ACP S-malonyltransferase [bacterium]|nr:ACP S-malonyltransferase [bacterium]